MTREEVVEEMAEAHANEHRRHVGFGPMEIWSDKALAEAKREMQAALSAASRSGFVLVKREPSEAMIHAGIVVLPAGVKAIYAAMVDASEQSHD